MAIISDKAIQAKPGPRDTWLIEDGARGAGRLVGRITPTGARSFYFRYSASNGDRVRLLIGSYDPRGDGQAAFTVQQARDKARELSALYRSGVTDLREHFAQADADRLQALDLERRRVEAERRAIAEAEQAAAQDRERRLTVRQVFDRWRSTELQPRIVGDGERRGRKDGGDQVAAQFERYLFPLVGDRPIQDMRRADILAAVDAASAAGRHRIAQMLYADFRQLLNFALVRELIATDPMVGLKRSRLVGAPVKRNRALSDDEVKELLKALPGARLNLRSAAAIWLILATGVRLGEAMGAVWADAIPADPKPRRARMEALQALADDDGVKFGIVDVGAKTWHLPDTKNQRSHTIHLSGFALTQLAILRDLRETIKDDSTGKIGLSPWLFSATDARRPVCPASLGKQLADRQRPPERRMKGRSKATDGLMLSGGRWTAHDLRRTTATIMARLGISTDVIHECLNHKPADQLTAIYVRDRREADQSRAFDALGIRLAELTGGPAASPTNVVRLKPAA